jgi:hypothetical protein
MNVGRMVWLPGMSLVLDCLGPQFSREELLFGAVQHEAWVEVA